MLATYFLAHRDINENIKLIFSYYEIYYILMSILHRVTLSLYMKLEFPELNVNVAFSFQQYLEAEKYRE